MKKMNLLKLAGLMLMVSSACSMAGNILHPRAPGFMEPNAAEAAELVSSSAAAWVIVHGVLLAMVPILTLGLVIASIHLFRNGEKIFSTLGIATWATFGVLSLFVFMLDGFTGSFLASEYEHASALTKAADLRIFHFNYVFGLIITAVSFVALAVGMVFTPLSMLKAKLGPKWLGWLGLLIGLVGIIGYPAGVFGPYWVYSPVFPPYIAIFSLWLIALGVVLYRDGDAKTQAQA